MKLKEKISLEKIFEKEYKDKLVEPKNNKEAVITHFLHNSKNGVSQFYKKDAVKFTKEILQYKYPEEEITNIVAEEALQYGIFDTFGVPFPPLENPKFKFIDLFAGIGGFRLAMQNIGGKCVFTSEWDKEAKRTYTKQILEKDLLVTLPKKKQKPLFQMVLICFVQAFHVKRFQLLENVAVLKIQEERYFLMLLKS